LGVERPTVQAPTSLHREAMISPGHKNPNGSRCAWLCRNRYSNICAEIDSGVMGDEWPGRAVELAERTHCVLVVVDCFPATTHMILRYADCVRITRHSRNALQNAFGVVGS
jgi:hypothetical protein